MTEQKKFLHCQLFMRHMKEPEYPVKFDAHFPSIPRVGEFVWFDDVASYFVEDKESADRLYKSTLDSEDPVTIKCKVIQVMYFDETAIATNQHYCAAGNALAVLYLEEWDREKDKLPKWAP